MSPYASLRWADPSAGTTLGVAAGRGRRANCQRPEIPHQVASRCLGPCATEEFRCRACQRSAAVEFCSHARPDGRRREDDSRLDPGACECREGRARSIAVQEGPDRSTSASRRTLCLEPEISRASGRPLGRSTSCCSRMAVPESRRMPSGSIFVLWGMQWPTPRRLAYPAMRSCAL